MKGAGGIRGAYQALGEAIAGRVEKQRAMREHLAAIDSYASLISLTPLACHAALAARLAWRHAELVLELVEARQ